MAYIGNQPTTVAFLTDQFSGTGSQTAFTLSAAPANTASILVAVSGVLQDPSTYSVSGTTLTFSAAPPSGTGNISVRFLGIPASGVVTTAYRTQTEFTATAGQTTFTPPSYTVGFIDVYRNGVLLGSADFTATNGTTVVLATGATAGDLIETVAFSVSSVLNAIPATAGSVNSTYLQSGITITSPTITSPTISGTYTAGTSLITSGTSVSASTTAVQFASIPSWVQRITMMIAGVSTNGTTAMRVQLGTGATPTYSATYVSIVGAISGGTAASSSFTDGFAIQRVAVAAALYSGTIVCTRLSTNVWTYTSNIGTATSTIPSYGGGSVDLGAVATAIRLYMDGTDTFDAGTINILYE